MYKNTLFAVPYFNFYPAVEECYYVFILFKLFVGVAEINHNASFKDIDSSMAM